jgi:hypothetical protein
LVGLIAASVIARSEATKQSSAEHCAGLLRFARNDGEGREALHLIDDGYIIEIA